MPPRKKFETIDEYIATFPEDMQDILEKMRKVIQEAAPESEEAISYGMPTFKFHGNLVHFAAYKTHIGFYPAPSGIAAFKEDISGYKNSKGAVKFPRDKPIPYDLVEKMVIFRAKENLMKKS